MVKHENDCVGCPPEIGCLHESCPYRNAIHMYCDICGNEEDVLYEYEDEQICTCCLLKEVPKVDLSRY